MMYILDPDGNVIWSGSSRSEVQHWRERATVAEESLIETRADRDQWQARAESAERKAARFAMFDTSEWRESIRNAERAYRSRSKGI
jgi:hypothetical protein